MALARLLPAAGIIENHPLHHCRIVEIGDGRVVKRNVPVFSKSDERKIDRRIFQQACVSIYFPS